MTKYPRTAGIDHSELGDRLANKEPTKTQITPRPNKFKVHFNWAKIERRNYEIFAADADQAKAIAQEMFRESYKPDCLIQEFISIQEIKQ